LINWKARKKVFINRQPTLWRHGLPLVDIIPIDDDDDETIRLNPLFVEPLNADFDGDCVLSSILICQNDIYKILHISEFNKHVKLEFIGTKEKENGVIVDNYKVLDDVYIPAISEDANIEYKKITNWSIHRNLKMFDIKVRNKITGTHQFQPISVSENHSLVVFDKKLKKIVKMTPADFKEDPDNVFFIICKSMLFEKDLMYDDYPKEFGWLVGSWLGDGSVVSNDEKHNILKKDFGADSDNKKLPSDILEYSDDFLKGLLAGYIDTDGSVSITNINFTSKSKNLLELLKYVLQIRFDVKCSKIFETKKPKIGSYYLLHLMITRKTIDFFEEICCIMKDEDKKNKILSSIPDADLKREHAIHYVPKEKITKDSFKNCSNATRIKSKKTEYITNEFVYEMSFEGLNTCQKNIINKQQNNQILLIPGSYIDVQESSETTGYDLTVEGYKTFTTADGLFVYDTLALYVIHDQKALEDANKKAYLGKDIYYDHSDEFLALVRHEALYSAYILTKDFDKINQKALISIEKLSELPETTECFNNPAQGVLFNNNIYSYGICLFNKWCSFDEIIINQIVNKRNNNYLSQMVYDNCDGDIKLFYRRLNHLEKSLFFYISINNHFPPTINLDEMTYLATRMEDLAAKIPDNIEIGYIINSALIKRSLDEFGKKESTLYNLFKSGSRFSEKQLSRSNINIGFVANAENKILPMAFKTNLVKGLTEREFFECSSGTRKGISDKSVSTPDSGYLERTLAMGLSVIEIAEEDCGSETFVKTHVISEKHIKTLIGKYYKLKERDREWLLVTPTTKLTINQEILLRSPITCQTANFKICKKCWGEKVLNTKYIGILAGQVLAERFTQLTLRSFHDSGAASLDVDDDMVMFVKDHLLDINFTGNTFELIFDVSDITVDFSVLDSFVNMYDNIVLFSNDKQYRQNKDSIEGLKKVKNILRSQASVNKTPSEFYTELTKLILDVGTPYSSFVECLLANMFLCNKQGDLWRYNQDSDIYKKLGDKTLSSHISPLLNLLYQQNQKTIENIDYLKNYTDNGTQLTIYEKLFLEIF